MIHAGKRKEDLSQQFRKKKVRRGLIMTQHTTEREKKINLKDLARIKRRESRNRKGKKNDQGLDQHQEG